MNRSKMKIIFCSILLNFICFSDGFFSKIKINLSMSRTKLVTDVVVSLDRATSVTGKLCWPPSEQVTLASNLAKFRSPKSLRFVDHFETQLDLTHHELIVVDLGCPDINHILKQANHLGLFKRPYRWLLLGGPQNASAIETHQLDRLDLFLDSYVIVADEIGDKVELLLLYKADNSRTIPVKLITEHFGTWSPRYGLRKSQAMAIPNWLRRKNLDGTVLTVAMLAVNKKTETDMEDTRIPDDGTTKISYRMLTTLFNHMNMSAKYMFTKTTGYYVNGSWNGMVGDVDKGGAEILGGGIVFSHQRLYVVDYLTDPFETTLKFVFRQPSLSYQNNIFVLPFTGSVWLCFGGLIIVVLIVLFINAKWENDKAKIVDEDAIPASSSTLMSDMMMMVSSMISQQGSSIELTGTIGRLVMVTVFISFMFLFVSYSANIVALLQASSTSIRTIADLANSRLELGAEDALFNRFMFKDVSDPVKKAIHDKIYKSESNFMTYDDGVKRMQTTPFAFHMLTGAGYGVVNRLFYEHEKCGLQEIAFMTTFQRPWICTKKESPYFEFFKIGLYRLRENGVSNRENKVIFSRKPKCESEGGNYNSVTITDVYPAMLLYIYGCIMAFALLGAEMMVYRSQKRKSI